MDPVKNRLELLEKKVEAIEAGLKKKGGLPGRLSGLAGEDPGSREENLIKTDSWFNRSGILLFLLGVAYFFKYAVEQGWVTPFLRISLGFLLGGFLMKIGFRVHAKNRLFSQVMTGGSIAVFYITIFSAFHIEKVFPFALAFILMILATAAAFTVSIRFNDQALSIIGALGGILTPFVLYTGIDDYGIIVSYICVIFTGTCLIYLYREWTLLMWVLTAGTWVAFITLYHLGILRMKGDTLSGSISIQAGVFLCWLVQWMTELCRGFVREKLFIGRMQETGETPGRDLLYRSIFLLSPLISIYISMQLWDMTGRFWGLVSLLAAGLYLSAYFFLRRFSHSRHAADFQWKISLALATSAILLTFDGNMLLVALSVESVALHIIISKIEDKALFISANGMFIVIRCWLAYRLVFISMPDYPLHPDSMAEAFAIVSLFAAIRFIFNKTHARLYFLSTHLLFMVWLLRLISAISGVSGYSSVAWCIYAVTLYIISYKMRSVFLSRISLATLFAVVAKLLFYDIGRIGTVFKVAIFSGLGLGLLVISYAVQSLMNRSGEGDGR